MECVWDGPTLQYIIIVHDSEQTEHRYKTVEALSTRGAGSLRGRGTRVWKVVSLDDPVDGAAAGCVLKDCWADQGTEREGAIVEAIVADAEKKAREWEKTVARHGGNAEKLAGYPDEVKFTRKDLENLTQRILIPSIYGDVILTGGVPDKTLDRTKLWPRDNVPYHYLWHTTSQNDTKSDARRLTQHNPLKDEHRNVFLRLDGRRNRSCTRQRIITGSCSRRSARQSRTRDFWMMFSST